MAQLFQALPGQNSQWWWPPVTLQCHPQPAGTQPLGWREKGSSWQRKVGWMFYLDGAFSPVQFLPFFILFFMFWALAFRIKVWCSSFCCQQEPFLWLAERDALSSFMLFSFSVSRVLCPTFVCLSHGLYSKYLFGCEGCAKKKSVSFPSSMQVCLIGQYFWIQGRSALKVA